MTPTLAAQGTRLKAQSSRLKAQSSRAGSCSPRLGRWALGLGLCALITPTVAQASQPEPQDLKRLSIEELMQIDVTATARRAEPVGTTAAAVSVITGDDIRRAGVTTIADALALAGGVLVARSSNGAWAVTARGFNGSTPNKLLVMVDGRTVYSPLFTGVFWNTVDYLLEDIDRIEVMRGPVSEMNDPQQLFGLRSSVDLARNVEFDVVLRAIDELPDPPVPAYAEMTLRLGWRATPLMDVLMVGHDLLHDHHPELGTLPRRVEFERGFRMGTTLRF